MKLATKLKLGDIWFGDLEAFDEARSDPEFFRNTFVTPASLSPDQLRNNRSFIVIGRKGAGKTAIQMHLADKLKDEGYVSIFFRFLDDMKPNDFNELTKTQGHITFAIATDETKLFLSYDYRDVWTRIFFNKLAVAMKDNGVNNRFTAFCSPEKNTISTLFSGISKALKIKATAEMLGIAVELGINMEDLKNDDIPLNLHNQIARHLLVSESKDLKYYFFIDELVFSRLDSGPDQIRVSAAMVRDIIRSVREINSELASMQRDIHFVASLRPEIRNLISDMEGEIGKILDGKSVALNWIMSSGDTNGSENSLLDLILRKKVEEAFQANFIDVFAGKISFGDRTVSISQFLRDNTWGRPRDIVRLLIAIKNGSQQSTKIGEAEIKAGLDEYSRTSLRELFDEMAVSHGSQIIKALRQGINKKIFTDDAELWNSIGPHLSNANKDQVIDSLFQIGVIQGYLANPPRHFSSHRGETYMKQHHKIRIHPALWNELGIRSL